jgi:predicted lipoprotein with Yx(FWY)xxD motif
MMAILTHQNRIKEDVVKKICLGFAVMAVLLLGVNAAMGMQHAVKIQEKEGVGRYFTDTEGKALYWFKKDSVGKSACAGPCLEKWPPYCRDTVAAPSGIKAEDFGILQERMVPNRQPLEVIHCTIGAMTKKPATPMARA